MKNSKYSLKSSKADSRDFAYVQKFYTIKESVDLREWDSPIEDQYRLGSCVGNAIASAYELMVRRMYPKKFDELSRLFIYYNARLFDNTLTEDVGAYIRDGLKGIKQLGVCKEQLWPYDVDKFDDQPSPECYVDATNRVITEYRALTSLRDMLETLADGYPIVVGIKVYESFDSVSADNPVVPDPTELDVSIGGHAVVIVGYELGQRYFLIKNSYGLDWGNQGYAWLSFEYIRNNAFEKWRFEINDQTKPYDTL